MAAITMTFDVPETNKINISALKLQVQAFINAIIAMPNLHYDERKKSEKKCDMSIFDSLSNDWGGDGDANEIAERIRSSRLNNWNVDQW